MRTPTLGQAVRDAIEAALAAARFHDELAARTDDARARRFLQDMARVQHVHGSEIASAAKDVVRGDLPDFARDDAEAIETLPEWSAANGLTLDEALEITLTCARKASVHYAGQAGQFNGAAAEFLHSLATAAGDRERMIERVLVNRIASQRSRLPLPQIGRNIVEGERSAARSYRRLAAQVRDAAVQRFLDGMASVQQVVAGETERRVVELTGVALAIKPNLPTQRFEATAGQLDAETLSLPVAMRLSASAERRSALVYRSMGRCVDGAQAALVADIALAEEAHARRIESALEQL